MSDLDVEELLSCLVPALMMGGLLAIALAFVYFSRQARQRAWGELASRLGLAFEPGGWLGPSARVNGVYRGHDLTLDTFTRGAGKSRTTYTRIVLSVNNVPGLSLMIQEANIFRNVAKALGAQDIQVGDEELDRRFVFKGQPEETVRQLLMGSNLRSKLLESRSVHVKVQDQQVYFEKTGVELNGERLQSWFDLLAEVADAVERQARSSL